MFGSGLMIVVEDGIITAMVTAILLMVLIVLVNRPSGTMSVSCR